MVSLEPAHTVWAILGFFLGLGLGVGTGFIIGPGVGLASSVVASGVGVSLASIVYRQTAGRASERARLHRDEVWREAALLQAASRTTEDKTNRKRLEDAATDLLLANAAVAQAQLTGADIPPRTPPPTVRNQE